MAINVTYNPIMSAMQLAQSAGEAQGYDTRWKRVQDVLNQQNVQASQALQLRGLTGQETAREIQNALAYDQLAQRQRESEANQQMRAAQLSAQQALQAQNQEYKTRDQLMQEQKFFQQQAQDQAFKQQFGGTPQEVSMNMRQQEFQQRQESMIPPEAKRLRYQIQNLQEQLKQAQKDIKAYSDPLSLTTGDYSPVKGKEKEFTNAWQRVGQAQQQLEALNSAYQQSLNYAMPGQLPQYGAQAASQVLKSGTPEEVASVIQSKAQAVIDQISKILTQEDFDDEQSLEQAVIKYLVANAGANPKGKDTKEFAKLITNMLLKGK